MKIYLRIEPFILPKAVGTFLPFVVILYTHNRGWYWLVKGQKTGGQIGQVWTQIKYEVFCCFSSLMTSLGENNVVKGCNSRHFL